VISKIVVLGQRLRQDLAGGPRRAAVAARHHGGRGEMLVQVVDPNEPTPLSRAGQRDLVEHRHVLDDLAQADASDVRADQYAELRPA